MAMWHIMRLETPANGIVGLTCESGEYPVEITLQDLDTGEQAVVQACWDNRTDIDHQCANLTLLGVTYNPNDWSAECA